MNKMLFPYLTLQEEKGLHQKETIPAVSTAGNITSWKRSFSPNFKQILLNFYFAMTLKQLTHTQKKTL